MTLPIGKHLRGAIALGTNAFGHGLCIHRSAALVLDQPGAKLCFGTLRGATPEERITQKASPEDFIHAWVEYRGALFAPTTIERMGGKLIALDREEYYSTNGVRDIRWLSRRRVVHISGEIGLSDHLRRHVPAKGPVGETLLNAAGVSWRRSAAGGVLPAACPIRVTPRDTSGETGMRSARVYLD